MILVVLPLWGAAQPACVETNCCCGDPESVSLPSGDFEDPPFANPIIVYWQGETFGSWTVISGSIDVLNNYLNWGNGNPNGASQYIDLHGSSVGAIETTLNGLIVGNQYTIVLWYAKNSGTPSANCQIQVANGAWLDETWTATNNGADGWMEICFEFIAQATSAPLSFSGSGGGPVAGVLLDDITLWTCPADIEPPLVNNPPPNPLNLSCEEPIPDPSILNVSDNCPGDIEIIFEEESVPGVCIDGLLRTYTVTDACGNSTSLQQQITIDDITPPEFIQPPVDFIAACGDDFLNLFYNWIQNNGEGNAIDNCDNDPVWTADFLQEPDGSCDSTQVNFNVEDFCGNMLSWTAYFVIQDNEAPDMLVPATDKSVFCPVSPLDSILDWLANQGGAVATDLCGPLIWSNDFDGDSGPTEIGITFIVEDQCGNITSTSAFFYQIQASDTTTIFLETCDSLLAGSDTVSVNIEGCETVTITTTTWVQSDEIRIDLPVCDPGLVGMDTLFLLNQKGCDSLIITERWYLAPDTMMFTNYTCDPNEEGTVVEVLQGMICDSLIITNTYLLASDTTMLMATTCDTLEAGLDTFYLTNLAGCDSLVIRQTVFQNQYQEESEILLCEAGMPYADTLVVAAQGTACDSIFITRYVFHTPDTTLVEDFTCVLSDAGIFTSQYQGVLGCDSTVIETITYQGVDTLFIFEVSCDSLLVGVVQTVSPGLYCDTIRITATTWSPFSIAYDTVYSCDVGGLTDTLVFVNAQGCDSILVRTNIQSTLEAIFQANDESCLGLEDGMITLVDITGSFPPYTFAINSQGFGTLSTFTDLMPGVYTIAVMDSLGCVFELGTQTVAAGLPFTIDLGADITANPGDVISLTAAVNGALNNIQWVAIDGLSCASCLQTSLGPLSIEQTVRAIAFSDGGCLAEDELWISLNNPAIGVYIPNSFSPNYDGINDIFTIYGGENIREVINLSIFDRWGNFLYSNGPFPVNDTGNGWDGHYKQKLMDPGVYIYVVELALRDGSTRFYKGDVTLIH